MMEEEEAIPKLFLESWEHKIGQNLSVEALSFFHWNWRAKSSSCKKKTYAIIPPSPNFTLGTMQSDKYHSPGNHQTQTGPSESQMEKLDSSLL